MPLPPGAKVGKLPDGSLVWLDAQGNPINPDGTPITGGAQATPLTPAPNTAGAPAATPAPATAAAAAPVDAGDPTAKTRAGSDAFLTANGLDPAKWHLASNTPVQKTTTSGAATINVPDQYIVTALGPNGEVRTLTLTPQNKADVTAGKPLDQVDWNVTAIDQGVKPNEPTAATSQSAIDQSVKASQAATAKAEQDLKDAQAKADNIAKNVATRGLAMTDQDIATMDATLKSQGLTQQQIDNAFETAKQNNAIAKTTADAAVLNAQTNAKVAASNQAIEEAKLGIAQAGSDQAAIKLAQDNAESVARVEHLKILDAQNEQTQKLAQLTQQQTNAIAQGTLGVNQANATENARHNAAVEAQTAASNAQTAESTAQSNAINAAQNVLTNARSTATQGAQAGAQLLSTRAAQAAGGLQNLVTAALGNKNFGAGGGIPADLGANLVQGLGAWTAELSGGQATLDAAARMVAAADPTAQANDPTVQKAISTLSLLLDKWQGATGQKVGGGPVPGSGVSAPVTGASLYNPQASTAALNQGGFQDTPEGRLAASQANPALLGGVRSGQPAPGAQAPAVNINISGGGPPSSPNPWTAYQSAAGSAVGQPATPGMTTGNTGAAWGVPGGFRAPQTGLMSPTPPSPFLAPQTVQMPVAA